MRLSRTPLVLLPVVSALSDHATECLRQQAGGLASISACGDAAAIRRCLAGLAEGSIQADIEQCLLSAGCGADDAALDASAFTYLCEDSASWAKTNELRKRQRQGNNNNNNADEEGDTANADEEETPANTRGNQPATRPAATPSARPQQTPDETPAETTAAPAQETTPSRATAAPQQTITGAPKPSQGTECYATRTVTEQICDPTGNCEEKPIEKVRCLDGFLCRMDSKGQTTCMEKVNSLDTGGIIVAIIFAAAIVVSIGLMTYFCCRDKAQQKKLAAKAEAAAIAKASSAGKRARNVSDRQPLMTSQPNPQGYGPGEGAQPDPFNDQNRY